MKKILSTLLVSILIVGFSLLAIMPSSPSIGECGKFHPHVDELGGPNETLKILTYAGNNLPISVWTDGVRTVVTATYKSQIIFMVYGTGNPTMFPSTRGIDYLREQTNGLKQVTSPKGLQSARDSINNCLKNSYESKLATASTSIVISSPSSNPYLLFSVGLIGGLLIILGSQRKKVFSH